MGLDKKLHILFFNEFNCVLLCMDCNTGLAPSRKQIWDEHLERYGAHLVEWYDFVSAIFKVPLQQF